MSTQELQEGTESGAQASPGCTGPQNSRHRGTAHLLTLPPARCSLSVLLLPLVQEPAMLGVQVGGVRSEGLWPVGSTRDYRAVQQARNPKGVSAYLRPCR